MSEKIIRGVFKEKEKSQVEELLEETTNANLDGLMVLGWKKDKGLFFSSTINETPFCVFMCERIKLALIKESEKEYEPECE